MECGDEHKELKWIIRITFTSFSAYIVGFQKVTVIKVQLKAKTCFDWKLPFRRFEYFKWLPCRNTVVKIVPLTEIRKGVVIL